MVVPPPLLQPATTSNAERQRTGPIVFFMMGSPASVQRIGLLNPSHLLTAIATNSVADKIDCAAKAEGCPAHRIQKFVGLPEMVKYFMQPNPGC